MTSKALKPETLSVNKKLLKSVKSTKIRYDEYIISQKLERAFDEKKKQRKAIVADILPFNNKMCSLEKICKTLTKDFEKLM